MTLLTNLRLMAAAIALCLLAASAASAAVLTTTNAGGGGTSGASGNEQAADDDSPYRLASQPVPAVTGAEMVEALDELVTTFPLRYTATPTEIAAAEWIRARAEALGYDTEIRQLPVSGSTLPGTGPLKAVTAFKQGTDPSGEVMLFIGHYDTLPGTIDAAYDNGTGTIMLLALAEALAEVETNRSVMFAWYNGEEEGALASARHAAVLKAEQVKVEAVFGFDMVGIAWPVGASNANSCLCMWHGGNDAGVAPIMATVNFDFLGFPNTLTEVQIKGNNTRNSDERSFENAGAVTMRWAGLRTAGSYRAYHAPDDSIATMVDVAGGMEYIEAGLRNTLLSAYYTALALDTFPDLGSQF